MKERHQGRALAAGRHVFAPEIVDDVDAGQGCEQATVADLIGHALARTVKNRVAMKADHLDRGIAAFRQQGADGVTMKTGELGSDLGNFGGALPGPAAEDGAKLRLHRLGIRNRQSRAAFDR